MCMLKQIQNNLSIQTTIVATATLQQNVFLFQIDIPYISNLYNIVNISFQDIKKQLQINICCLINKQCTLEHRFSNLQSQQILFCKVNKILT